MAERPVFLPFSRLPFVEEKSVSFKWHAGLSRAQAQRSIAELHASAQAAGLGPLLEISSKGSDPLGIKLSAFNLTFKAPDGRRVSVESAYQGSKTFKNGDHFPELYRASSRDAKLDERVKGRSDISGFDYYGTPWPAQPMTAFYDWLYLQALEQNQGLMRELTGYSGFTDIAFNPQKSSACQARCAAMYIGLQQAGLWPQVLAGEKEFVSAFEQKKATQSSLF